jgi:hypothetical protein
MQTYIYVCVMYKHIPMHIVFDYIYIYIIYVYIKICIQYVIDINIYNYIFFQIFLGEELPIMLLPTPGPARLPLSSPYAKGWSKRRARDGPARPASTPMPTTCSLSLPPPPLLGKGPIKGSRKEAATAAAVSPVWGLPQPPPPPLFIAKTSL